MTQIFFFSSFPFFRHCERSEAISSRVGKIGSVLVLLSSHLPQIASPKALISRMPPDVEHIMAPFFMF
jgi:hypothetical protein